MLNLIELIMFQVRYRLNTLLFLAKGFHIVRYHLSKALFLSLLLIVVLDLSINLLHEVSFLVQMEDYGILSIALYTLRFVEILINVQLEVAHQLLLVRSRRV